MGKDLRPGRPVVTADGTSNITSGKRRVVIGLQLHCFRVTALVMTGLDRLGVDCLLGGDVIRHMGGVTIIARDQGPGYNIKWGKPHPMGCCGAPCTGGTEVRATPRTAGTVGVANPEVGGVKPVCGEARVVRACVGQTRTQTRDIHIEDTDFVADFTHGRWTVSWRWSGDEPKGLQTRMAEYRCTKGPLIRERYCAEVDSWISKGWLQPWDGPVKGIIPLLAVFQPTKDKVRPVMDYRELNAFVECHTGDDTIAVCGEKLREWRQLQGELKVVDLKSAYLQIHVSKDLWQYQVVRYNGKHYALTRLGFGLSCAPRIMTMILGKVLRLDERVCRGTDHYIDDIVVQESIISAQELREHLSNYGLESKEPEGLDGGRLLGVALQKGPSGHLMMSRGSPLPELNLGDRLTKRGLFSLCGRLVGHYPVAGWLRPCCSYLKRLGCDGSWDEPIDGSVQKMADELLARTASEDPVRGRWQVNAGGPATVWTDASSIAMGVALEIDGSVVEDGTWLRKESDVLHINVAELEAVARGINLALAWGLKSFVIATDSQTVVSWMVSTINKRSRIRTKGAAEMLVKRRLRVIAETITEFGLSLSVRLVPTAENKADRMTRVPQRWLGRRKCGETMEVSAALVTGETLEDAIWAAHLPHHLGIDRTLYLAKQIRTDLTRAQVKSELAGCEACQQFDPALRGENLVTTGSLAVEDNWSRVAVDVTHCKGQLYLSMVDCGPSRFAIWRKLSSETATHIVAQLRSVVLERGPCAEFLMDNATAFRSATLREFADDWGIALRYRAAYVPSGNGIVERNHRTIKRIVARGDITPEEAAFWYNVTPRKDSEPGSVPSTMLFKYPWRVPYDVNLVRIDDCLDSKFAVGDEVWVKPHPPSCTRQWASGVVTRVVSSHTICVDGMPRHVRDVRLRRVGRAVGAPPMTQPPDEEQPDNPGGGTSYLDFLPFAGRGVQVAPVPQVAPQPAGPEGDVEPPDVGGATEPAPEVPLREPEPAPDVPLRRSGRLRRPPAHLDDYVTVYHSDDSDF